MPTKKDAFELYDFDPRAKGMISCFLILSKFQSMIGVCFLIFILKGRTDVTSILSPYFFLNLKYHIFVFIDLGTPLKFGPVPINFKGIVNLIF